MSKKRKKNKNKIEKKIQILLKKSYNFKNLNNLIYIGMVIITGLH